MECGARCAQIMLIVFNVIFWLSGAALLGVGIWILVDDNITSYLDVLSFLADSGAFLRYAAYVLIGIGSFVLVVGFLGCCGAIRQNKCMLGTYIFFLVLVMGGEIAAGVLAIIYRDDLKTATREEFVDQVNKHYDFFGNSTDDDTLAFTQGINLAQRKGKCCGWSGPSDYDGLDITPYTCCVLKEGTKDDATITKEDVKNYNKCKNEEDGFAFTTGCEEDLKDWIHQNSIILIGVGIGIACLELFGFIFAVCLCRNAEE